MNDNYGSVMKSIALVLFVLVIIVSIIMMVQFTFFAGLKVLVSAFVSCLLLYGVGQIAENTANTSAYTEMIYRLLAEKAEAEELNDPKPIKKEGDWVCKTCGVGNPKYSQACKHCGELKR